MLNGYEQFAQDSLILIKEAYSIEIRKDGIGVIKGQCDRIKPTESVGCDRGMLEICTDKISPNISLLLKMETIKTPDLGLGKLSIKDKNPFENNELEDIF
jgi:hypothetical protein